MMREESSKIEKFKSTNTKTSEKFINFQVENDDVLIQEVSDNDNNSSTGNLIDNQLEIPEIEFESEENLENEKIVAIKQEGHFKILSIETFPYCTNEIPDLEESILHEINCSKNDFKTRRSKKRAALESYFSPCFFTPRYLDSIKEEGSDLNDVDVDVDVDVEKTKNNLEEETKTSKSSNNDIEDNHSSMAENQKFIKKLDVVFPKSSLDFSQRKRHVSNLPRTVNKCIIQEEIPCYIVEAKILEQIIPVEENCCTCINETIANPDAAEIIYLESTSSSSSDIMDLDNIGADDADIEDLNDNTDMKITTLNIDINDDEIYFFRKSETPTKITNESVSSEYHNNNDIKSVCSDDNAYGNENRSYANCEKNESKNIFDYDNIHPRNTQKEISRDADDFIIHDNYQTACTFQTKNNNQRQNFCDQFCANTIKKIKNETNNNFDIASSLENNLKLADEVNQNQEESYERNQQFSDTKNNEKFSENNSEVNTIDLDSQYEKRLLEIKKVASECIQEIIHKCEQQLNSKLEIEENLSGKINILKINNNTNNLVTEICDNMNDNDTSIKSLLDEKSEIHNKQTDKSCENINVENINQHHLSTNGEIVKTNLNVDNKKKCENFDSYTSSEKIDSSISNVNIISTNENSVQNVSNDKENVSNTEQNNININVVEYNRQDSSGSDNSHSTDHSLCTAINKGSFSHIECDIEKDSLESSQYLEQKSSEIMSSETTSIKTLRQLCVGKLITMPYGNVVLEELASFAKSLSDLTNKYEREKKLENSQVDSLLKLPQFNNIETSASKNETDTKIQLSSPLHSDNLESSPPPVPELPVDDIWLMVSAQKNLKMPLSMPSLERNYLKKTKSVDEHTADHSFDMQKISTERGGYNELIAKKFNKNILPSTFHSHNDDVIQSSSSSYTQQPPTIPPPLPRSSRSYNTEKQIAIDAENNDKNNHRLLAIIRDSKQPLLSENESRGKVEQVEKLPSQFKTNNHHYWCDQQLQKAEKIERNIEKKEISESTKLTETTIIKGEKMPFKIDGEEYNRFPDEDIFNNNCKKFYNMESTPYFCNQLRQTLPKRYSNIETSSYKTEKRMENGNVVYEYSDSNKEKVTDEGKESDQRNQINQNNNNSTTTNTDKSTNSNSFGKKGEEFSDFKPRTFADEFSYEEFRRRAKESAKKAKDEFLKRENFFKSYDDITKYFEDYNEEKQSNKIFREKTEESKIYSIPIKIDSGLSSKKQNSDNNNKTHGAKLEKNHSENDNKNTYVIPVVVESKKSNQPNKSPAASAATTSIDENVFHIPVILEENNSKMKTDKNKNFFRTNSLCHDYNKNDKFQEKHRSHQNLNECMCCTVEFDASPKNITKPFRKEVEIIHKARQSNAKAPRLSVSTSNLSMEPKTHDFYRPFSRIDHYNSSVSQPSIDQTPISCFINPRFSKRASLPDEIHNQELDRIKMKEIELRAEFEKLENERCRLVKEMDLMAKPSFLKDYQNNIRPEFSSYRSRNLSNSFEEDTFRQMYNEWLNKVAEREERRLHKIIKISKPSSDITQMYDHNKERKSSDISDEFLKRVKERRSKLHMPSDSDWESGAESQPISTENNENDKISHNENVKVIEGQTEADLNHLPKHLREFVEFTSQKVIDNENVKEKQHKNEISSSITIKNDSTTTSTSKSSKITETKSTIKNSINRNDGQSLVKEINNQQLQQEQNNNTIIENKITTTENINNCPTPPPAPSQPIWTPQPSPTTGRKEFRPIKFQSPNLPRRYVKQDSCPVPPPWANSDSEIINDFRTKTSASCTNLNKNNTDEVVGAFKPKINSNSTNSLIQRTKENLFGKGASSYTETTERTRISKNYTPPIAKPNEVVYSIKHEYMSEPESENDQPKKMAQLGRRQYEGIGPTTKDGMPIVLRSEIKENNQHKWYKRIYNTLHKAKDHGRYPYKSNGYMSEPETHYESDYSTMKYHTIEKQSQHTPLSGRNYGSMPSQIKSAPSSYKNQPGRIEDYIPGHSSVSEMKRKDQIQQEQFSDNNNYSEGYLSRVLKQQGYESDSNLIFRKKKDSPAVLLSPVEQKQAYKSVQAGGEPPLHGFRKPAPEKSKDNNEIKYFSITPTLTKIRVLNKKVLPEPQQEVICYPITNISRPLDLFGSFPKNVPSFIPISRSPPPLPNRSSSRKNAALKIYSSNMKEYNKQKSSKSGGRHENCFQKAVYRKTSPTNNNKYDTITIRKHAKKEPIIVHSKSADAVSKIFSASVNEEFIEKCGSHISRKQKSYLVSTVNQNKPNLRKSSPSPVAFGRSISKERTFAEEKKRLEEVVPLCRRYFNASTNILRDPSLKSPNEVKKAVRSIVKPLIRTKSAPKEITCSSISSTISPGKIESKLVSMISRCDKGSQQKTRNSSGKSSIKKSSAIKSIVQATKMIGKSSDRQLTKSNSTQSLIKTNSTFSIDSNGSKKKTTIKKPLTITHSMSKTRASKSQSKSNYSNMSENKVVENIRTEISKSQNANENFLLAQAKSIEEEIKQDTNTEIMKHIDSVRTDDFFRNLFLKDLSSIPTFIQTSVQPVSVLEKARYWNTISAKSEPSLLRRSSFYLSQKRPVSDSKFLSIGNKRWYQSRSLSPTYRKSSTRNQKVFNQISKFNSFHQTSKEESEFDEQAGQTEKIIYKFEQRNNNESSPNIIHGRKNMKYTSELMSPSCVIKSPSRRRIQSFKGNQKIETKKVIRAKSLSSADERSKQRFYDCNAHSHSISTLNVIEGHSSHCSLYNSNKFRDLNKFYEKIEKVGQLERATSSTDLHPIRKEGEIIDFDEWKKIRAHDRALKEMYYLVEKLKQDGKEKDFLYKSKYPEDIKWNETNESGLRCKEKSVEDLRETFERKNFENDFDEIKRFEIESKKDTYKPLWRAGSVIDTATNMIIKCNMKNTPENNIDKRICLSKRLISTLTKDQLNKIKSQLSEIYSNGSSGFSKDKNQVLEDYVITVDEKSKNKVNSLKIRCNSSLSKDDLLGSVLKREQSASLTHQSTNSLPAFQSKSFKSSKQVSRFLEKSELSENDKKRLSQALCKGIQDKVLERKKYVASSPVARETFGAVATESAKNSLTQMDSEQQIYAMEHSCDIKDGSPKKSSVGGDASVKSAKTTYVYNKDNSEGVIQTKIKYFEEKKEEPPPKTIYHARDYSSPDEEEVFKAIEEKFKEKEKKAIEQLSFKHKELSSSLSDLKELFGERETTRMNLSNSFPPHFLEERNRQDISISPSRNRSSSLTFSKNSQRTENLYRSRSISPIVGLHKTPLKFRYVDIENIKNKFENFNKNHGNYLNFCPLRKLHSDPEITKCTSRHKVIVKDHEVGDVLWIANKFEMKNLAATRGRSRTCKNLSPIPKMPLRKEDRLMPHIDVISKTASLKAEMNKSTQISSSTQQEQPIHTGEVERIRCKFESPTQTSLLGQIYTSSPDISELKDISTYLTGDWIAHRYPNPRDNARSPVSPERGPENKYVKRRTVIRPNSTSPPRSKLLVTSILKPYYDIFANQEFDPIIHRPKARYIPDNVKDIWKNIPNNGIKKPSIVKFEESDAVILPLSTVKGSLDENDQNSETFRRYFESDVNIHYKTPIRYEYKESVPEEELVRTQAETMKKLYEEERHRKYLQELQDASKRRHTDNFTPSQKSPVPLNRYDDFVTNVAPKQSNSSIYPKIVARALYNFQGQTAKELTFKKGDIIYIRRQVDKNWYEGEHNAMIGLLPANYIEIITKDGTKQPPKKLLEGQARAKFNFQAQSAIELSLNKGELVTLTRRVDENWFEGKIANRKGIFPVSYVEVLTDIGSEDNTQQKQQQQQQLHQTHNKPIGIPVSHSLITCPNRTTTTAVTAATSPPSLDTLRTNIYDEFDNLTNNHPKNTILRETKSIRNTEVLHIDTNTEPIAYRALYKYRPQNNDELELQENDIVYVLEKCDDGWYVGTSQRTGCFGTFPGNYVERVFKDTLLK